ncbi:uncharacterized protein BCR38DRAFT_438006 [Pseudomassariella vexata]|uniref:Uncharacterized protein n=1 Tax=Pseudomassariella vexata TaxID=1141098 RepID=A0A1Y2DSQ7_9PEZI|nr:uncharacterized protein BCR38DRAFT_438006 [Pseudomassariella vexata]ORY62280.1 hypothetical protein BCR38DRAFT_438006 [Pseudomassariella vexata]
MGVGFLLGARALSYCRALWEEDVVILRDTSSHVQAKMSNIAVALQDWHGWVIECRSLYRCMRRRYGEDRISITSTI